MAGDFFTASPFNFINKRSKWNPLHTWKSCFVDVKETSKDLFTQSDISDFTAFSVKRLHLKSLLQAAQQNRKPCFMFAIIANHLHFLLSVLQNP